MAQPVVVASAVAASSSYAAAAAAATASAASAASAAACICCYFATPAKTTYRKVQNKREREREGKEGNNKKADGRLQLGHTKGGD